MRGDRAGKGHERGAEEAQQNGHDENRRVGPRKIPEEQLYEARHCDADEECVGGTNLVSGKTDANTAAACSNVDESQWQYDARRAEMWENAGSIDRQHPDTRKIAAVNFVSKTTHAGKKKGVPKMYNTENIIDSASPQNDRSSRMSLSYHRRRADLAREILAAASRSTTSRTPMMQQKE